MKAFFGRCVLLALCLALSINADTDVRMIATVDEFIEFADSRSDSYRVELLDDLDFSGLSLSAPIGGRWIGTNLSCVSFSGLFEGNNYTISGLSLNISGYDVGVGLFCDLENAEVRNLVIDDSCLFVGDFAGAISAGANGTVTLRNIFNKANVSGTRFVGGLIGSVSGNSHVSIDSCINDGQVFGKAKKSGDYSFGGIIGAIKFSDSSLTINNTTNNGNVTGTETVGGFIGLALSSKNSVITITNCKNRGNCSNSRTDRSDSEVTGLLGMINSGSDLTITIDSFTNDGGLTCFSSQGAFTSGLIGIARQVKRMNLTISNTINNGKLTSSTDSRCYMSGFLSEANNCGGIFVNMTNNTNNGEFESTGGRSLAGGFISAIEYNDMMVFQMSNLTNNAAFSVPQAEGLGGLIGYVYESLCLFDIDHGTNNGLLHSNRGSSGQSGMIGYVDSSNYKDNVNITLRNCKNSGNITDSWNRYGICNGFVGVNDESKECAFIDISNSINEGSISCYESYGIALVVRSANNVVSMGCVEGTSSGSMFWSNCTDSYNSLFCYSECGSCPADTDINSTLFFKEER